MALNKSLLTKRKDGAGADYERFIETPSGGSFRTNGMGEVFCQRQGAYDDFSLITAAALAIGNSPLLLNIGTGTEVIARSAKGGQNLKTQAVTTADNTNVLLFPAATTNGMYAPISAKAKPAFRTQVMFGTITKLFAVAGLDENAASNDVDPSGTAGDGASFFFSPTGPGTTEVTVDTGFTQTVISSAVRTSGVLVCTCATAHGLAVGDLVPISGFTQTCYNGQFKVLSITSSLIFTIEVGDVGLPNPITRTGTTTNGSAVVPSMSSTANLRVGDNVTGTGITAGTTVLTVDSSTQITLSAVATASTTGVTLTFDGTGTGSPIVNWHSNWILHQKVAGADVFYKTNVPVLADVDYYLHLEYDELLIPRWYINGTLVGTGTAGTADASVGVVIGLEATATPGGQKNMDVRYVSVGRNLG